MAGGFRRLAVYVKASALADELHSAVAAWRSFDRWSLGLQLVRAADSVGANLAEACGRRGGDRQRLLFIARGSAFELEHWLMRAEARQLDRPSNAHERARELSRMLNGMAHAWTKPDD